MGERIYVAAFENVTIAAVQDVFNIKAGAGHGIELRHVQLTAGGVTAAAEIRLRLKRHPVTVTQGSGGSTPTIGAVQSGDTKASGATAHANDTSQGTTSGTSVVLENFQWNVLLPFDYMPGPEWADRDSCIASEALVLEVFATPASTVVSGFIKWKESP